VTGVQTCALPIYGTEDGCDYEDYVDGAGWDFDSCTVIDVEPFINAYGYPASYNPKTGNGLSDHAPLFLTLRLLS
jgi:hypothetical protein